MAGPPGLQRKISIIEPGDYQPQNHKRTVAPQGFDANLFLEIGAETATIDDIAPDEINQNRQSEDPQQHDGRQSGPLDADADQKARAQNQFQADDQWRGEC